MSVVSRSGAGEQILDAVEAPPRRRERPAVPVDRQRARRLQVPQLEPAAPQVEIGLDDVGARVLRGAQVRRVVPGAVRDQQWRVDHCAPLSKASAAARALARAMSAVAMPRPAIATMPPTITSSRK